MGYDFVGWTYDEIEDPILEVNLKGLTGNKHFVANYAVKTFNVKFIGHNDQVLKEEIAAYGSEVAAPTNYEVEGYKFIGWSKDYYNITSDLEIYAIYEVLRNTLTLDVNGGYIDDRLKLEDVKNDFLNDVAKHLNITVEEIPFADVNEWHRFWAWGTFMPTNETNAYKLDYPTTKNPAFWNVQKNREKWIWLLEIIYETMLEYPGVQQYNTSLNHLDNAINKNFAASPETINKSVWYFLNGQDGNFFGFLFGDPDEDGFINSEYVLNKKVVVDVNTEDFTLPIPKKDGHTFIGWTSSEITEPTLNVTISNFKEDVTYVANYKTNTYKITLDVNGGDPIDNNEIEIEYDEIFNVIPTRTNHTFLGWFKGEEQVKIGKWNYNEDVVLQAKWYEGDLDVEFDEENGLTYIYYGSYPQTVVNDESLISALSNITEENELGYIEYNGNEYKKIISNPRGFNYKFMNGDLIVEDEVYYFLVEPIKWRVLEIKDNEIKLLSEYIIDNKQFHLSTENRIIDNDLIFPNNYDYSDIRAWLNGYDGSSYNANNYNNKGFLNIAFTTNEQSLIDITVLNATNDSNNLNDKVYLLSSDDLSNKEYGFNPVLSYEDENRIGTLSDFARTIGCFMVKYSNNLESGFWWLRTRDGRITHSYYTSEDGSNGYVMTVNEPHVGVRPGITLKLDKENTIIYKDYDGTILGKEYIASGSNATPPTNLSRVGYEFIGWDKEYTNIQSDLELKTIYKPLTYTLTLDVNGGDPVDNNEIEIRYDEEFDIIPVRDGYTFVGWYYNNKLVALGNWQNTSNMTLQAKWFKGELELDTSNENGYIYIHFGRYPQTVVTDTSLINSLLLISEENEFGYIEYSGEEYKKVIAAPYENNSIFANGKTITTSETYFFKVEPIKWRVLEENNGSYKLLSELVLDNKAFSINGTNNYEKSSIRAWLNGYDGSSYNVENYSNKGFLSIAFTEEEQAIINTTFVDNSVNSSDEDITKFVCNDTNDKIYLLSIKDLRNTNYGFIDDFNPTSLRRAIVTDYARATGNYISTGVSSYGRGIWWARTPHNSSGRIRTINTLGNLINDEVATATSNGVRPAITITLA